MKWDERTKSAEEKARRARPWRLVRQIRAREDALVRSENERRQMRMFGETAPDRRESLRGEIRSLRRALTRTRRERRVQEKEKFTP